MSASATRACSRGFVLQSSACTLHVNSERVPSASKEAWAQQRYCQPARKHVDDCPPKKQWACKQHLVVVCTYTCSF